MYKNKSNNGTETSNNASIYDKSDYSSAVSSSGIDLDYLRNAEPDVLSPTSDTTKNNDNTVYTFTSSAQSKAAFAKNVLSASATGSGDDSDLGDDDWNITPLQITTTTTKTPSRKTTTATATATTPLTSVNTTQAISDELSSVIDPWTNNRIVVDNASDKQQQQQKPSTSKAKTRKLKQKLKSSTSTFSPSKAGNYNRAQGELPSVAQFVNPIENTLLKSRARRSAHNAADDRYDLRDIDSIRTALSADIPKPPVNVVKAALRIVEERKELVKRLMSSDLYQFMVLVAGRVGVNDISVFFKDLDLDHHQKPIESFPMAMLIPQQQAKEFHPERRTDEANQRLANLQRNANTPAISRLPYHVNNDFDTINILANSPRWSTDAERILKINQLRQVVSYLSKSVEYGNMVLAPTFISAVSNAFTILTHAREETGHIPWFEEEITSMEIIQSPAARDIFASLVANSIEKSKVGNSVVYVADKRDNRLNHQKLAHLRQWEYLEWDSSERRFINVTGVGYNGTSRHATSYRPRAWEGRPNLPRYPTHVPRSNRPLEYRYTSPAYDMNLFGGSTNGMYVPGTAQLTPYRVTSTNGVQQQARWTT